MTTTVLLVWCVGSFLIAPLVGRALRGQRAVAVRMRLHGERAEQDIAEVA